MSAKTKIEWTDATWNPVTGCTKVSRGCQHCYAERDWRRLAANPNTVYQGRKFTDVMVHPERLDQPKQWRRTRKIFVNSMSDLFHESVPDTFIAAVFAAMARAPQHVYQILTKRPIRMREIIARLPELAESLPERHLPADGDLRPRRNVWLGVSVEDNEQACLRLPTLMNIPDIVRFASFEPLLGPVRLFPETVIDWAIVGGESGSGARRMLTEWALSLRDQCAEMHIPFYFKQWGEFGEDGKRCGKTAAGRLLDGREWNELPLSNFERQQVSV